MALEEDGQRISVAGLQLHGQLFVGEQLLPQIAHERWSVARRDDRQARNAGVGELCVVAWKRVKGDSPMRGVIEASPAGSSAWAVLPRAHGVPSC